MESCRTDRKLILLTGATGYIGGRLLKALEQAGYPVRCLARRPEAFKSRVGIGTEVTKADCLDPASLPEAVAGVHTAFYLVHSMASRGKFEEEDRQAARNFADAARDAGVRRVIYLGGLGEIERPLRPICAAGTKSPTSCGRLQSRRLNFALRW